MTTNKNPRYLSAPKHQPLVQEESLAQSTAPEEFSRAPPTRPTLLKKTKQSQLFLSSLIDTVKMRLLVRHPALVELARTNPNLQQKGSAFLLTSPTTGATARIFSTRENTALFIELSLPKWLTGQNIVGGHDMHSQCLVALDSVFNDLDFLPSPEDRRAITKKKYTLTRADVVVHVDCIDDERASAVMTAIRALCLSIGKDFSCYGTETVYMGQHSKRRTLKVYRKDLEVEKAGLPTCVMNRSRLLNSVEGLVRIELTLRRPELERLGIAKPADWYPDRIPQLLAPWISSLSRAEGQVANADAMDKLNAALQSKLNAWLRGDTEAFTRNVKAETTRANRRDILKTTGIDIALPIDPALQRCHLLNIRTIFADGLGYRNRYKMLEAMIEHVKKC